MTTSPPQADELIEAIEAMARWLPCPFCGDAPAFNEFCVPAVAWCQNNKCPLGPSRLMRDGLGKTTFDLRNKYMDKATWNTRAAYAILAPVMREKDARIAELEARERQELHEWGKRLERNKELDIYPGCIVTMIGGERFIITRGYKGDLAFGVVYEKTYQDAGAVALTGIVSVEYPKPQTGGQQA